MESISANPLNLGAAMGINGGSGYPREIQLGWKERVELCMLEVIRMFLIYYPQVWKIPPLEFLLAPSVSWPGCSFATLISSGYPDLEPMMADFP